MQHSIHPDRLMRSPRARLLAAAALVSGLLAAGCGGSSHGPTAATTSSASTSASTTATARAVTTALSGAGAPSALAFSECMRSNGVPNFPDPKPGGGFEFPVGGGNIGSPAFRSAQAKCMKLMPGGAPRSPARRPIPPQRRWRNWSGSPRACARTASPSSQTPGHPCRPTRPATRRSPISTERSFCSPARSTCSRPRTGRTWPHAARRRSASITDLRRGSPGAGYSGVVWPNRRAASSSPS